MRVEIIDGIELGRVMTIPDGAGQRLLDVGRARRLDKPVTTLTPMQQIAAQKSEGDSIENKSEGDSPKNKSEGDTKVKRPRGRPKGSRKA